jgi:hypothetical protein
MQRRCSTIRDASTRILRRARILADGTQVELIDNLEETGVVDVIALMERAPMPVVASLQNLDRSELQALLQDEPLYDPAAISRSCRCGEISAVRNLVPSFGPQRELPDDSAAISEARRWNSSRWGS